MSRLQTNPGQRVLAVGIEARRDEHEVGPERDRGRQHDVLEQRQPEILFRPGWHRQVDRVPLPLSRPDIAERTAAGEKPRLVDAREQHVRAAPERLGGAVAVMDVQSSTNTRRAPSSRIAGPAAIATLLNRQKPIARAGSAW